MEIRYRKSVIHQSVGGEDMVTEVFLPDFGDGQEQRPIGIWGQRHLRYIKEYRKPLSSDGDFSFSSGSQKVIMSAVLSKAVFPLYNSLFYG